MSDSVNYVNVSGKKIRGPTDNNIDPAYDFAFENKPNFSTRNSIRLE